MHLRIHQPTLKTTQARRGFHLQTGLTKMELLSEHNRIHLLSVGYLETCDFPCQIGQLNSNDRRLATMASRKRYQVERTEPFVQQRRSH